MSQILLTDTNGTPKEWVTFNDAACYHARGKVVWEEGEVIKTMRGGRNVNGEQSLLDLKSILFVTGPLNSDRWINRTSNFTERLVMYGRDKYLCAYCGNQFSEQKLTIDHIHPRSRGGKNVWTNCITACKPCNLRKADRTPEEARMPLLYVPYVPNAFEKMILRNKKILSDQMEFLIGRVGKNSRLLSS